MCSFHVHNVGIEIPDGGWDALNANDHQENMKYSCIVRWVSECDNDFEMFLRLAIKIIYHYSEYIYISPSKDFKRVSLWPSLQASFVFVWTS
jgi:hypothetical protein